MNKAGVYISTEARITDEQVFFYVPEGVAVNSSDEETVKVKDSIAKIAIACTKM